MSGAEADSKQETFSRFITSLRDTSSSSTGLLQSLLTQHEKWILKEQDKNDGKTVLHHAVELPHRHNFVDSFLTKCPEAAKLKDKKGQTAGHIVVKNCYKNAFDILWSKNAMLSYVWDDDGYTLLHYACMTMFPDETSPSKMICADPGAPIILEKILQYRPVLCLVTSQDGQLPIDMLPDERLQALCEYYTLMGTQIVIEMSFSHLFSDVVNKHVREKTKEKYLPYDALATVKETRAALKEAKQILSHESLQLELRQEKLFPMLISRLVSRGWSGFECDDFGQRTNLYRDPWGSYFSGFGFGGKPPSSSDNCAIPNQQLWIQSFIGIEVDSYVEKEVHLFCSFRKKCQQEWLKQKREDEEHNHESSSGDGANTEKLSCSQDASRKRKSSTEGGKCSKMKIDNEQEVDNAGDYSTLSLEILLDQKELHLSMAKKLYDYAGKTKHLCDGELNDAVYDLIGQAFKASCKFADISFSIVSKYENGLVDGKHENHDACRNTPGALKGETKVELVDLEMTKKTLDEMADVLFGFAEQIKSICGRESDDEVNALMKRALEASSRANNTAHTLAAMLFAK